MKNFSFKRLTSWLLAFLMVIAAIPAGAVPASAGWFEDWYSSIFSDNKASEEETFMQSVFSDDEPMAAAANVENQGNTIYVLAGGDFQEAGDHTASANNVSNILSVIKPLYPTMNGFLFAGDYDCETHNDSGQTTSGIAKLMQTVQSSYSNINHDNSILVQGNHDATNQYIDGSTDGVYGYDLNGYAAFVMNEDQYPDRGGTQSGVQALANKLNEWLTAKLDAKYEKPIFVISHLPLAFNPRTGINGDAKYGKLIFDVLNDKAAAGLNIIFLHGHNHAYGYDEYLGGHAIYYPKGDSINIANLGSQSAYTSQKLNFTYMNAGYTGYYNESGYSTNNVGTDKLSMTVFAITDNEVTVGRYSADGAIDLKAAGEAKGDYYNRVSVTPDARTFATTQTITLNKFTNTITDNDNHTSISASGITAVSVTKSIPETIPSGYTAYVSYDINPTGYVDGNTATVEIEVDDGIFDVNYPVFVIDTKLGTRQRTYIVDGKVTFTTNHFSEYIIAQMEVNETVGEWVEVGTQAGAPATYRYVLDNNTVDNNAEYLIVAQSRSSGSRTYYRAMTQNSSNNIGRSEEFQISNNTISETNDLANSAVWTIVNNKIKNGNYWLRLTGTRNSVQLSLTDDESQATSWTFSGTNNKTISATYTYNRYNTTITGTGYLRYNNNAFTALTSSGYIRLYKRELVSEAVPGETIKARFESDYSFFNIERGTSEADAIADLKEYIKVYTTINDGTTKTEVTNFNITIDGYNGNGCNTAATIWYNNISLGTVGVKVAQITNVTFPVEGYVKQYSPSTVYVKDIDGNILYVTVAFDDGTTTEIPIMLSMLTPVVNTRNAGDVTDLSITTYGHTTNNFILHINEKQVNNYPDYPTEGSVKVNKSGTGIDFQNTGVAQVELTASGVPLKKGADVIIMIDTSSSMTTHNITGTNRTRASVMEASLSNLIAKLKQNGADGQPQDIKVAIADFNGFYGQSGDSTQYQSGTPYDRDANDRMSDADYQARSYAKVFTGNETLTAGAFVNAQNLANSYSFTYRAGTNYDYAMDAIYQLGASVTAQNAANDEERDLFVVFLSDGAAMQWNYYHAQGQSNHWNHWITGDQPLSYWTSSRVNCTDHLYYFDTVDHDGDDKINEHRMANAIKGSTDPNVRYEVIRKSTAGITDIAASTSGKANMYTVPGLGAKMFTIAYDALDDGNTTAESMKISIESLASKLNDGTQYYYDVKTESDLANAFNTIGSEIAYAATNAYYDDMIGDDYSLRMTPITSTNIGTVQPKIEVLEYQIITRAEQENSNGTINESQIGNRKNAQPTIIETVTFNNAGTEAYSDKKGANNILIDGVIHAQAFYYNTTSNNASVTVNGNSVTIQPKSFYWILGTVRETEKALRYYVYLDGSMEGTREAGSYPTNEYAVLHYTNYLGNTCEKPTISPQMPWKSANVSYAFYLVDGNGNIVTNRDTGALGSFPNRIAITDPVEYSSVLLNSSIDLSAEILANQVLPTGYSLYDEEAKYTIAIRSGTSAGDWAIDVGEGLASTTYVTKYDPTNTAAYTNATTTNSTSYDYTHTIVWFAVKWEIKCIPDMVVIDYGIPVNINVLENDLFGSNGQLIAVGEYSNALVDEVVDNRTDDYGTQITGEYGTATANTETGYIKYALDCTGSDMTMNDTETFIYVVKYTGNNSNVKYCYGSLTIIPATTIYYEETFVDFSNTTCEDTGNLNGKWSDVNNSTFGDKTQAEDRPGYYSPESYDHDFVYGYDSINNSATTYSLGNAKIVTVDAQTGTTAACPTATFTFTGTGFDIISLTDSTAGTIVVEINGPEKHTLIVNNYYGYTYNGDEWVVTPNLNNSIYQVPVIKKGGLTYGTYTVTIKVAYISTFVVTGADTCTFTLDSIRIYDPAGYDPSNTVIRDAYIADNEYKPHYILLKDKILEGLNTSEENTGTLNGSVFIDGQYTTNDAYLYKNPGPNNEAYLAENQAITFKIATTFDPDKVMLGIKLASGGSAQFSVTYTIGSYSKTLTETIDTATDMYYEMTQIQWTDSGISNHESCNVTITNTSSDSILSLTNLKITEKATGIGSGTNDNIIQNAFLFADAETLAIARSIINPEITDPEITDPEITDPEITDPEITDPEITDPGSEDSFAPAFLDYAEKTVKSKKKTTEYLLIVTSNDVDSVTVNGNTLSRVTRTKTVTDIFGKLNRLESQFGVDIDSGDYSMWMNTSGIDTDYEIVAYDVNGMAADTVYTVGDNIMRAMLAPTAPNNKKSRSNEDYALMEQLASRSFEPQYINAEVGSDITGNNTLIIEASEDVDYVIANGEIINRYIAETVIDLSNDNSETTKRVFVAEINEEDVNVTAYDDEGVASDSQKADKKADKMAEKVARIAEKSAEKAAKKAEKEAKKADKKAGKGK